MRIPRIPGTLLRQFPRRFGLRAALVLIGITLTVDALQGQEPKLLEEVGELGGVRTVGSVVLGSLDDPFDLSSPFATVHKRQDGGYVVLSLHYERGSLGLYDREGRFAGEIGGPGEGPGEHRRIVAFAAHALDSVFTVDASGRFNVFNPDGDLVRTGRMSPVPWRLRWLHHGRRIAAADSRTPRFAGIPLHLMSPEGTLTTSFGSLDEVRDPRSYPSQRRRIPVASGTGREMQVYSVSPATYRIDAWSTEGEFRDVWVRKNQWFPPTSSQSETGLITGVYEDGERRLWVAIAVADPHRTPEPETEFSIGQMNSIMDTVVEVVDLSAGRILASGRFEGRAAGFSSAGDLITLEEDGIGMVRIRLLKLDIVE